MSDRELRRTLCRWVGYVDAIGRINDDDAQHAGLHLAVKVLRDDLRRHGIPTPPAHFCGYDACAGDPTRHDEPDCPTARYDEMGVPS